MHDDLLRQLADEGRRQAEYQARRVGCPCADSDTRCDAHRGYAVGWAHGAQTIAHLIAERMTGRPEQRSPVPPPCGTFVADEGGAHPWCATCGWQRDHHPDTTRLDGDT